MSIAARCAIVASQPPMFPPRKLPRICASESSLKKTSWVTVSASTSRSTRAAATETFV